MSHILYCKCLFHQETQLKRDKRVYRQNSHMRHEVVIIMTEKRERDERHMKGIPKASPQTQTTTPVTGFPRNLKNCWKRLFIFV